MLLRWVTCASIALLLKRLRDSTPKRKLDRALSKMHTKASIEHGLNFKPRSTDVFITTYPKTGTTWVQQICHGLRTRGSMEFEEITQMTPWTICALDCGLDLTQEQVANPRLFKSHENYTKIPKSGKYIYVMREPKDVLTSFYWFLLDYVGLTGQMSVEEFASQVYMGSGTNSGTYWDHICSWHPHFGDSNVCVVFFEDLLADLPKCVQKIARFLEIEEDKELEDLVVRQSSFSFMKAHQNQFDGHWVRDRVKGQMGVTSELRVGKIRSGKAGAGKTSLPPSLQKAVDERWLEIVTPQTGFPSYSAMRKAWSLLL